MGTSLENQYFAFISYSQKDKKFAQRLHRALESFTVPRGVTSERVPKSRRLGRVFRDDDEMGASTDLGAALRTALDSSENLIVICSPNAAQSRWVDEEIKHFAQERSVGGRIFAVIIDGTPAGGVAECFPASFRSGASLPEPLAIDLRADGFARMLVRLVAGLIDVPFDALWKRAQRRRRAQLATSAAAALAILAVIGGLSAAWLEERRQAVRDDIAVDLSRARQDFAGPNALSGFTRLAPHLETRDDRDLVGPTLRAVLGWAQPLSEQLARLKKPRLFEYSGGFFLKAANDKVADLTDLGLPIKRVILNDRTNISLIFGDQKTAAIDTSTGARLSEKRAGEIDWRSYSFLGKDESLVVLGTFFGSTSGTIKRHALMLSKNGRTLSTEYLAHAVDFQGLLVSPECDGLIVKGPDGDPPREVSITGDSIGARDLASSPHENSDYWSLPETLYDMPEIGAKLVDSPFADAGCGTVGHDSDRLSSDSAFANEIELVIDGLGVAAADAWRRELEVVPVARAVPNILDEYGETYTFDGDPAVPAEWLMTARSLPVPRGYPPSAEEFDRVDGQLLGFVENIGNAGVTYLICPQDAQHSECWKFAKLHDERLPDTKLRSPNGEFLFLSYPGILIDLKTLKTVNDGLVLAYSDSAFDFEPDRNQLTFVRNNSLQSLSQNVDRTWSMDDERAANAIFALESGQKIAGLLALGSREYIFARSDGAVARVNAEGEIQWRMSVAGIGTLLALTPSPNRRYFLVIGERGARLFATDDGLALSNILEPPAAAAYDGYEPYFETCWERIHVRDDGEVSIACADDYDRPEATEFWRPVSFGGDLAQRVDALSCASSATEAAVGKMRRCASEFLK